MPRTGYQAWTEGLRKMHAGVSFPVGTCLKQQRILFDVGAYDFTPSNGRDPWAIEAFDFAQFKHSLSNWATFPSYVEIYWRKAGRPGHIALYGQHGSGICLTTDPTGHPGRFGIMKVDDLTRAWGMTLVGWAEDLNKVRIWTPPPVVARPKVVTPTVRSRYEAIDKLASGIYHDTADGTPNHETAWKIHALASARI